MRVSWTPLALDDLRRVNDWLEHHADASIAARTLRAIRVRAVDLERFPHMGRPHDDGAPILLVTDTRDLIRYRILDNAVQLLRVHHERANWFVAS